MIRKCTKADFSQILEIINDSAKAYKGTIPEQLYREPFVSSDYLESEMASGVRFSCYMKSENILGVMGVQDFDDVTLIRHSYIRTNSRRKGIGGLLIQSILKDTGKPVLVGCLKTMTWAISFYEKHGFTILPEEERDSLRAKYWKLSKEHVVNSVVMGDARWINH